MKKSFSGGYGGRKKIQVRSLKNIGNNNGETPLHIAAQSHRAKDVKFLLDAGADANAVDHGGNTPLHLALVANAVEVVKVLITHSATDLNVPRKDGETPLILALSHMGKERQLIVDMVNNGANVNVTSVRTGTTPLHWATMNNILDLVDELMEHGANLEARDGYGRTPLHYAKPRIAYMLLEAGADAIAQDYGGHTPLHLSVLARDVITFRALLEHTPNLNTRTLGGMTPLISSVIVGMEAMTTDLMSNRADVDVADARGMTALHWASLNNCSSLADALLEYEPKLNMQDESGCTPLHYAKAETAKRLLEAGADALVQNNDGRTALHLAVVNRDTDTFQVLLPKTTDLNTHTHEGVTPLMSAVHIGLENMAIDLMNAGADVNAADDKRLTSLHRATLLDYLNLVTVLVEKKVDLNAKDANGCTALHYAKAHIARCLVNAGADGNVQNNAGLTPLHVAVLKGDSTVFGILLYHTTHLNTYYVTDGTTPLTSAVRDALENMVYDLIRAGANLKLPSRDGMTPLHWAADFSHLPKSEDVATSRANIAKMLLDAGVSPNVRNFSDDTPLHTALNTKAWPILNVLLEHKSVDVNVPHVSGKTLLMLMLQADYESRAETFEVFEKLVIKTGALINAKDSEQMTALLYAAKFGKCDELNVLLKYGADIHAADQNKMTALHYASFFHVLVDVPIEKKEYLIAGVSRSSVSLRQCDKTDIIKKLISAGANTAAQDKEGRTPLHSAIIQKNMNVFKLLLPSTSNVNTCTNNGMTPLMSAVDLEMKDMVSHLVNQDGVHVDATDCHGATALHFAANFSNLPKTTDDVTIRMNIVKMLIDARIDPNLRNNFGDAALHIAVKTMAWPVAEALRGYERTDLNIQNMQDNGKTPLMMLLEGNGNIQVFENLINAGANVNLTDSRGKSTVHYAVEFDKYDELNSLCYDYSAKMNAVDESGNTPVLLAAELKRKKIFDLLLIEEEVEKDVQRTSDGKTLLMVMLESPWPFHEFDTAALKVKNINLRDNKLRTVLHYAAKYNKLDELISLIDLEADIDPRDCEGQTPLFVAASEGNFRICYNLAAVYSANTDFVDSNGKRPVDIARENNHEQIFLYLNQFSPAG